MNPSPEIQIKRACWHDYKASGYYMLTFTVENRKECPFGIVTGDSEDTASVRLTPLGMSLEEEIEKTPRFHPEIEIIDYVVMPDHCHVLVHVKEEMKKHLGNTVRAIKSVVTKAYLQALDAKEGGYHMLNRDLSKGKNYKRTSDFSMGVRHTDFNPDSNASASSVSNSESVAHTPTILVSPLFAQGYHDRIVTRYGQIATLRKYIRRNAPRLWIKQNGDRALFTVRILKQPLALPLAQELKQQAAYWDEHRGRTLPRQAYHHDGKVYAQTHLDLLAKFLLRDRTTGSPYLRFRACGNVSLLQSGRPLVRVRISRSVTREALIAELSRLLTLCEKEGAILVSPFISWSEKEVLKALRVNRYPHIILHGKSMSEYFKPSDASHNVMSQYVPEWYRSAPLISSDEPIPSDIDCVAEGSLLILAPWHDRPKSEHPTKADCELMNKVCEVMERIM